MKRLTCKDTRPGGDLRGTAWSLVVRLPMLPETIREGNFLSDDVDGYGSFSRHLRSEKIDNLTGRWPSERSGRERSNSSNTVQHNRKVG